MDFSIRSYHPNDLPAIVALSLLAWEPVFESFARVLGPKIYPIIYPDWRKSQEEGVSNACQEDDSCTLVAETKGQVLGFILYKLHQKDQSGEIWLLAVHPDYQNDGIGTDLNNRALAEMRNAGMKLAVVGTGGDEGHAPARRAYEKAGFTPLPLVRYYQDL